MQKRNMCNYCCFSPLIKCIYCWGPDTLLGLRTDKCSLILGLAIGTTVQVSELQPMLEWMGKWVPAKGLWQLHDHNYFTGVLCWSSHHQLPQLDDNTKFQLSSSKNEEVQVSFIQGWKMYHTTLLQKFIGIKHFAAGEKAIKSWVFL